MVAAICLNCNTGLLPGQQYCPNCGQRSDTGRISFRKLTFDFLHALIKIEKSFITLVKGLAIQPGDTATEYVKGKRKTYLSPFAFMTICIAFVLLLTNIFHPYIIESEPNPAVLGKIVNPEDMQLYLLSLKRIGEITRFGYKYMSTITILIAPFFAFFLWLFFKRRGWNMAEITVAYIFFGAFSVAVSTMIFTPIFSAMSQGIFFDMLLYGSMFLQTLYIAWGFKVFFQFKTAGGYWKVVGALFLAGVIGFILLIVFYFIYVYRGNGVRVLRYLNN